MHVLDALKPERKEIVPLLMIFFERRTEILPAESIQFRPDLVGGHVWSELDEEGAIPSLPIAEDTGIVRFNWEIREMNENIELES